MTSESPSRPLASVSLPQWMKSKMHDSYDLEQAAFSPPSQDDGFFLIRYGKTRSRSPERSSVAGTGDPDDGYRPIGQVLRERRNNLIAKTGESSLLGHTEPCQLFIPKAKYNAREIGLMRVSDTSEKVKSAGIDDGFKGDAAACGYSVLQVAQNMVSGESRLGVANSHQRVRRNSKSLPASPLSSPKLSRKNLFFTDSLFSGSTEGVNNLSARLGMLGVGGTAMAALTESADQLSTNVQNNNNNNGNQQRYSSTDYVADSPPLPKPTILKPKPTELREMNFWSPTSM